MRVYKRGFGCESRSGASYSGEHEKLVLFHDLEAENGKEESET